VRVTLVPDSHPTILILGPTAGGKTDLALALAQQLTDARGGTPGGECICADSMQVYRRMDIGTAKPPAAERAVVPHHMLDLVEPSDDGFTVEHWLRLAHQAAADIRGRGRRPIIVGGTNLYVQAFLRGLVDGPEPDPALRQRLEAATTDELRVWLERVDPAAAARLHRNDRKRTIRAIEVFEITGTPLSAQQTQWEGDAAIAPATLIIGLDYPVELINRRINARVHRMIDSGLVEEVRGLLARQGGLGRQAREAVGYKQMIQHLAGEMTLEEAIEQIKIRTRRFAKQQRNWLKRFRHLPGSTWFKIEHGSESEWQGVVQQAVAIATAEMPKAAITHGVQ